MPPRNPTDILAAAAAIAAGTQAYGQAVRFDNIGLQFDWNGSFLDIMLPSGDQESADPLKSAFQHSTTNQYCYYYFCPWLTRSKIADGELLLANWFSIVYDYPGGTAFSDDQFEESWSHPFLSAINCDDNCYEHSSINDYEYIPARFQVNDNTHFGWIQSRWASDHMSFEALAWGYQKTPGQPATAGAGTSLPFRETATLLADDGSTDDQFGQSIATRGEWVGVGAYLTDLVGPDSGSVHSFRRSGSEWSSIGVPAPAGLASGDFLGSGVAFVGLQKTILVCGAPRHDTMHANAGIVYWYELQGEQWKYRGAIEAPDAAPNDQFGLSVAADGEFIAVGAPRSDVQGAVDCGAVYIFHAGDLGPEFVVKITQEDPVAGSRFGASLAISAEAPRPGKQTDSSTLVVGAPLEAPDGTFEAGAVYGYWINDSKAHFRGKVISDDAVHGGRFGAALSITTGQSSDQRVWVGAPGEYSGADGSGAAYLIEDFSFPKLIRFAPSQSVLGGAFGSSVAVNGAWAAMGARGGNGDGAGSGCAEVHQHRNGEWGLHGILTPTKGSDGDLFGHSIVIGAGFIGVGSLRAEGPGGPSQGSVSLFTMSQACYPDLDLSTGTGNLDLFDFLAFINLFNVADPKADCDKNGLFDLFDFLCFTNAFNEGCP